MAENPHYSRHSPYSTKRVRHACENCRRKKSRCPGERPKCSFCVRLRQQCVYATNERGIIRDEYDRRQIHGERDTFRNYQSTPSSEVTSGRLGAIEERLEQVVATLREHIPSPLVSRGTTWQCILQDLQLPDEVVSEGITLYFENYCNQPCPVFDHLFSQRQSLATQLPSVVLCAMLALSLRSSSHPFLRDPHQKRKMLSGLSRHAWNLLSEMYSEFTFNDAYFQALCLLAQVDFAEGKPDRARTQLAQGLKLAQARGMLSRTHFENFRQDDVSRHQEIVWTLFMLERMFIAGFVRDPSVPNTSFKLPAFQGGPQFAGAQTSCLASSHKHYNKPPGIVAICIEMIRIWELVVVDINQSSSDDDKPFWRDDSSRGTILSKLLEFELDAEPHTYISVGPPTRVREEPFTKTYFATWLFFEITHSAIHCSLNHPFIIFMKSRNLKGRVPSTFLQKSYKTALIYADWVSKFISEMKEAGLDLHDPFIGYLVSIAASIHLEHTVSKQFNVANSAKRKFEICLGFLRRLSWEWPRVRSSIDTLERLRVRVRDRPTLNYVGEEFDGAVPPRNIPHVSLSDDEIQLMWKLFDFSSMSRSFCEEDIHASGLPQIQQHSTPDPSPNVNDSVDQVYQYPETRQQEDNSSISDLIRGTMNDFGSIETFEDDWSLLGHPWPAYFPPDIEPHSS